VAATPFPTLDAMAQDGVQARMPYLEALRAYAARSPGRFHVPGHKGGAAADPVLVEAFGKQAVALDIPALTEGIDAGPEPTPFQVSQQLAAAAWGAERTWFLINGATQGNHAVCVALAHSGERVVVQRNVHSSTIDGLVLSGLRPTFVAPEVDPDLGVAHCVTPAALDRALDETPGATGAIVVTPTYFGAVADVESLAAVAHGHGVPLVVDEAWGAHLAFGASLPRHALDCGADLVVSSTHKIIGSFTQSAMLHLGHGARLDDHVVDRAITLLESTSPSSLLSGSLDAARAFAAGQGAQLLERTVAALAGAREAIARIPGLVALDERLAGRPGVHAYDPLRLVVDVRGAGASGYRLAELMRERDVYPELAGENVIVAVFGMGETGAEHAERLVDALEQAVATLPRGAERAAGRQPDGAAPMPVWGPLEMTPREAFLGAQEEVPIEAAVGRIAAEALAAYPPGIPNVLPGERLSAETWEYVRAILAHGGTLRGASDRTLRTARVAVEAG
jgi:arginine decarboxylase